MDSATWPKYTLTAMIGLIAGVITTFTSMTLQNSGDISALKAQNIVTTATLLRIEGKLTEIDNRWRRD